MLAAGLNGLCSPSVVPSDADVYMGGCPGNWGSVLGSVVGWNWNCDPLYW